MNFGVKTKKIFKIMVIKEKKSIKKIIIILLNIIILSIILEEFWYPKKYDMAIKEDSYNIEKKSII